MADALGTPGPPAGPGVVSALDHRLDQAGLIATQTSSLAVRTGVMVAPGSTALIAGTSATGTMTVSIAAHHWVTTRGTADGVYLGTKEAAGTVNIAAAPGANSRIDVVYVKQNDQYSPVTPDGTSAEAYGVVTGTAAVSPTEPALPVGALKLGTVTVASGATATNGAGVTINNTALQVSARGACVWVRNQAERDALAAFDGLSVKRIDLGGVEQQRVSGAWVNVQTYTPGVDPGFAHVSNGYGGTFGPTLSVASLGAAQTGITAGLAALPNLVLPKAARVILQSPAVRWNPGVQAVMRVYLNGVEVGLAVDGAGESTSALMPTLLDLAAGSYTVSARWEATSGTLAVSDYRFHFLLADAL